jgi:hypothetical protein
MKRPYNHLWLLAIGMAWLFLDAVSALGQYVGINKDIRIGGLRTDSFYVNEFNLLGVQSDKDSIQDLVVKSSQGDLNNVDSGIVNGFFSLTRLKSGQVTISVFAKKGTGLQLLSYRIFPVVVRSLSPSQRRLAQLKVKPVITINGYGPGKLLWSAIKGATAFGINKPFVIKRMNILLGCNHGICGKAELFSLTAAKFDERLQPFWNRLTKDCYVYIEAAEIADERGNIYTLNSIYFNIDRD